MTSSLGTRATRLLPRRADLQRMSRHPGRDVVAGLTVAAVALPLAMAFGITSGLGARAGLVTAVVAGVVAALLGGSEFQVSGPTGAMTVVLVPIIATHGPDGVLAVGLLAGLLLVALAVMGAGRWIRLVPLPVIEGFTLGIALIIALQQLPGLLGTRPDGDHVLVVALHALRDGIADPHLSPVAVGVCVTTGLLLLGRRLPRLPVALTLVLIATVVVALADLSAPLVGAVPGGFPVPSLPDVGWTAIPDLAPAALAVAALAALESLLSATVADGMTVSGRHDPDRELFGQGMANLAVPLVGGVPATAALARTAVNVRSGATSRLAAVVQSLALLVVLLVGSTVVAQVPLAALAGVLVATAAQMVEATSLRALLGSTRRDGAVLVLTATATLLFDLVTAVLAGLVLAGALALREVAQSTRLAEMPIDLEDHSEEEAALLRRHIVAFRLDGPLFFGAAHTALLELALVDDVRVVVLRMSHVGALDASGAAVLADTVRQLEARGTTVLLSGVQEQHARVLSRLGVFDELAHERHLFETTPEAIAHAQEHAARAGRSDR